VVLGGTAQIHQGDQRSAGPSGASAGGRRKGAGRSSR
jgi:hypothetical protein